MVGIASAATHAYRNQGVVLLRNQNIKSGYLDDGDILYIDPDYESAFKNKRLKSGDLLTARTGYPGTTCVVPSKYESAQSFTTLITRPDKMIIDSTYLCYYINSEKGQYFFEQNQIGGGQKNVNAGALQTMPIPVPSLSEQRTIATTLSDVDALITSLDQLIAKKRDIKQAAMQDLLTGKRRILGFDTGKGYKQTDIGVIPEDWEEKGLGSISTIFVGRDLKENNFSTFQDGEYQYPIFSNTVENEGLYGYYNISEYTGESLTVVGRGVGVGTAFKRSGGFGAIGRLNVIFPKINVDSNYLVNQINYGVKFHEENTGVPQLTGISVAKYSLPIPPFPEQCAIATVISDMDAEITELEQQRDKTKAIKQGMMQELLTGRIRLT